MSGNSPYKKYNKRPFDYRPMYRRLIESGATALVKIGDKYKLKSGVATPLVNHLRNKGVNP